MVIHLRRRRDRERFTLRQEAHLIGPGGRRALEAGWVIFREPVGQEFVEGGGFEDISRDDVGSDFACLFEEEDAEFFVAGFVGELFEADCGGEAGGSCFTRGLGQL